MELIQQIALLTYDLLQTHTLEEERLKTARMRIDMYAYEGKHMCIAAACRDPAFGKTVFAHCERLLTSTEKRWKDEDIESPSWRKPEHDPTAHPTVKAAERVAEELDVEFAKNLATEKHRALTEARELLNRHTALETERLIYLPVELRRMQKFNYEAVKDEFDSIPQM